MAKVTNTLNMDERVWIEIKGQAKRMKLSVSAFAEIYFAQGFGLTDLIPEPSTIKAQEIKHE